MSKHLYLLTTDKIYELLFCPLKETHLLNITLEETLNQRLPTDLALHLKRKPEQLTRSP
jgi:hypothetical protein